MLITELGSRPNLMEVTPPPSLPCKMFFSWNQYPEEGNTEAFSREKVGSGPLGKRDQ